MYSYLQNEKTNVSNAKRKRPKVIISLKSKRFFIGITPILLEWGQHTLQHDCPCAYSIIWIPFLTIDNFSISYIFLFVSYLLVTCQLPLNFDTIYKRFLLFHHIKNPENIMFFGVLVIFDFLCAYLFENCGARRADFKPYFFLSFILGSLVKKPAFLRTGR